MRTFIEHLGHTSFAIHRGPLRILIDPVLVSREMDFRQPACPAWFFDDLASVNAVFFSHAHDDHLHPPSLLGLREDVALYFLDRPKPGGAPGSSAREILTALGFRNLHPYLEGDVIELGEDVRIHALPAQCSGEGEEQCALLLETPDVLALDAVDVTDSPRTREALEPFRGRVDVAFVPTGASVQWQGFWNQLDPVGALALCEWLKPARIATCGGTLSMAGRPREDRLERYPVDRAHWMAAAVTRAQGAALLPWKPPYRLVYARHDLERCALFQPGRRFEPARGQRRPQALLTTFFTGYHPSKPNQRWGWGDNDLARWLEPFEAIREVLRASTRDLSYLLERCQASVNKTPAAVLAPRTLRYLVEGKAFALAARLVALLPSKVAEPADLDAGYFAAVEALLQGEPALTDAQREDLAACHWLDRGLFHLQCMSRRLKELARRDERTEALRASHLSVLRDSLTQRRPVLGPYHLRVTRDLARLLDAREPSPETAEVLCYASAAGIRYQPLSTLEALLLDQCDGRTVSEMVEDVSAALSLPPDDVQSAIFTFLSHLTHESPLVLDWSH
ncbi:MBL fold metallo-hydrolase [Corallococcus macrosporus]|uniref:MBL fold metallo-hydrolase n=1 Tax=Corallococcus macrosporus TaxID=35 RepID=UPI0002EAD734|nr:MBL fold metallo-hydrolase [Corallococcus macrosporus]